MLVRQQEAAWEGGWHEWEEAHEEEEAAASKGARSPGLCRTPDWGKTNAINTAADKIANGSLP
eukprot:1720695-Rhodomonas_salina.1